MGRRARTGMVCVLEWCWSAWALSVPHLRSVHYTPSLPPTIRALFSTVSPLSSHEVDGVRKEKERLTDGSDRERVGDVGWE